MKAQYQISLALGKPFPSDTASVARRWALGFRNRLKYRYGRYNRDLGFSGNHWGSTSVNGFSPGERGGDSVIIRRNLVFNLNQHPLEDVAHATIIKLEIVNVDARADSRTTIVGEIIIEGV